MKAKLKIVASCLLAVVLSSCVPSLHPLFNKDEMVFDANLVGRWSPDDSNEIWEFKQGGRGYECIYIDNDGKVGRFDVGLGKLQNNMFLDIYPKELNSTENVFYKIHFPATHSFARVLLTKDSLELRVMSPQGLDKLLKSDPDIIKHERLENNSIVLTASTEELQKFMLKYGMDDRLELFEKAKKANRLYRVNAE